MKALLHYLYKETFVFLATVKSTSTLLLPFAPSGSDKAIENQIANKLVSSNPISRLFLFAVFLFTTSSMMGQVSITTATGGTSISADKAANALAPVRVNTLLVAPAILVNIPVEVRADCH